MQDFFDALKLGEFFSIIRQTPLLESQRVDLELAGSRLAAEDVYSPEDLPGSHRSAMDGYAVLARDTFGAGESNPVYLEKIVDLAIEDVPEIELESGQCVGIVTGGTLPPGADSVVMVEHVHEMGQGTVEIRRPVAPWENVMLKGEDVGKGELILRQGQVITGPRTGLLAALGIGRVQVYKRPEVGIISTGDELVEINQDPGPGRIRDVNTHALVQMVREAGCPARTYGIVPDARDSLAKVLARAMEDNDIVLVSGGSSVGNRDFTIKAMSDLDGIEILAHGLALSPGKPTIFGRLNSKCIWGLPGQVTSAQVVMLVLVLPFLRHLQGDPDPFTWDEKFMIRAALSRNLASKYGRADYVRVKLESREQGVIAVPVTGKSGLLKTMLGADGLIRIPENCEGLSQGDQVMVRLI
ncbi:molybdopterin molybdotransferase MoeA [Desulfonatronovibrio hydrogenovorans]|uniref:molybdopterin molybdotransferase MoeA n=1 Tax=Desulfonatronovibrio hydrogenovorans TaxID=53245 RepID=UPI00048F8F51|nr:gephyrin-like molybdotransferase Glp [Desulfonatronovibrio hydrogenovorans]